MNNYVKKNLKKCLSYALKIMVQCYSPFSHVKKTNIITASNNIYKSYPPPNADLLINRCLQPDIPLSIIIPVYNAEKFIKRCLDSCLNQTTDYKYEIICINDGSKDSSGEILNYYKNHYSNINVFTQENKGISAARNAGINEAHGKYLVFVDNDDELCDGFVQQCLECAIKHNADIVKTGFLDENIEGTSYIKRVEHEKFIEISCMDTHLLQFGGDVWGTLYKAELFAKVQFPTGYWYEDMIIRLLLYRMSKTFLYIPELLYIKHLHKNNASKIIWSSKNKKAYEQYYLLREIQQAAEKIKLPFNSKVYQAYMVESGPVLYARTKRLSLKERKNLFILSADLMNKFYKESFNDSFNENERILKQSFNNYDFLLWRLISAKIKYSE